MVKDGAHFWTKIATKIAAKTIEKRIRIYNIEWLLKTWWICKGEVYVTTE